MPSRFLLDEDWSEYYAKKAGDPQGGLIDFNEGWEMDYIKRKIKSQYPHLANKKIYQAIISARLTQRPPYKRVKFLNKVNQLLFKKKVRFLNFLDSKEVKLLIVGSLISFLSVITVNVFTIVLANNKEVRDKRYAVIEQLSKDLGMRIIVTNEFHRAKLAAKPSQLDSARKKYILLKEKWNTLNMIYEIQISKFFSKEESLFYENYIYNQMIDMGQFCEYGYSKSYKESSFSARYGKLQNTMYAFVEKMYSEI